MIKYIIVILLIFAVLIASQYFKLGGGINDWLQEKWERVGDYWEENIMHRVSSEIDKRQEIAKNELEAQANEAGQGILTKIRNYLIGVVDDILGTGAKKDEL
ncbi:hypothetical protein KKG36_01940 [Patescibacteria group bacterium]|nr:hypothetical protein [Patescibacteria group bacterium]